MENYPTLFPVVAGLMLDTEGRILVQQRPEGTAMAGLWEFPGGKLEPGETPEAALVRELHEELGIRMEPGDCLPMTFASASLGQRHLVLLLFRCTAWQGEPKALHASALRWASVEELYTLPMPPADLPLLDIIADLLTAERVRR
jgi:8-oxo-dGTP diphosphatase